MFTNNDKYEVLLKSTADVNMSNWQITRTLDTLTMVNNKFVNLNIINRLINEGIDKKNIFLTDRSFLITTNYKIYFEKGNTFSGNVTEIMKMYGIGRLIPMEANDEIYKINSLFNYYKELNSITNKYLKRRVRRIFLSESYEILFESPIELAFECLTDGVEQQINDIFERHLSPDIDKRERIMGDLKRAKERCLKKCKEQYDKIMVNSTERFEKTYNRFDRPIVGVYHENNHEIEIINADQMYKNGEESDTQVKLCHITKNSPVAIAVMVTGPMVGFLGYLLYRNHKVDNSCDDIFDIPQSNDEAIRNIIGNEDGNIVDEGNRKNVDLQVQKLAYHNLGKLEQVTNRRVVHMEMKNKTRGI